MICYKQYKNLFFFSFTILLIFTSIDVLSQVVNIENKRQSDDIGWSGHTELSFDYNKSTQNDWEFSNVTYIQWDNDLWSVLILNEINVDRAGGVDFSNDGYQHLRISNHLNKIFSLESFVQNQYDPVRNIKNRKLAGLGLRYKLNDYNSLGITSFYEKEVLEENIENDAVRLSVTFQLRLISNKTFRLSTTNYIQPSLMNFSDYKLSNETVLSVNINDKFAFTNSFTCGYDTHPAIGIPNLIYNFQNGIVYTF